MSAREIHQRAVYAALTSIPELENVPVYDHVPPGAEYPYIAIGNDRFTEAGDSCSRAWEVDTEIRLWTGEPYRGHISNKSLQDVIEDEFADALAEQATPGYVISMIEYADSYADRDGDGLTYFGSVNYRIMIEEL